MSDKSNEASGIDLSGVEVQIVIPVHRDLPLPTVNALIETQVLLTRKRITHSVQMQAGNSIVEAARSIAAHEFLKSEATHCFWIDSDTAWKPSDFLWLLALGTKMEVVGAAAPRKSEPTAFDFLAPPGNLVSNEWRCLPLHGFGLCFTCVQRRVLEDLSAQALKLIYPGRKDPIARIFRCDVETEYRPRPEGCDGYFRGEDMAFFADCRALGYQPWLNPKIELQHIGSKAYSGSFMELLKRRPD